MYSKYLIRFLQLVVMQQLLVAETKKNHQSYQKLNRYSQKDGGFSLVEVITVVLMIGILAAIMAPNWLTFVNRQRVNKANDVVVAAIQEAQRQAKQKKLSYSVSFKVVSQISKIIVHPDSEGASSISDNDPRWQFLGKDLGVQSGQVKLLTNLTSKNTASTTVNSNTNYLNTPQTITFDYMGTLPNANFGTPAAGSTETPGLKVVATASNVKRCIIVKTILGSTLTAKDTQCN